MPVKKSVRTKAPVRRKTTAQRTKPARSTKGKAVGSSFGAGAIALAVVVCVVGMAMLLAAREPSDPGNADAPPSIGAVEPSTAVVEPSTPVVEPAAQVKKPLTSKTIAAIPSKKAGTPAAPKEPEVPAKDPEAPPAISPTTAAPTAAAREPEAAPAGAPAAVGGSMTVAGCLERTGNGFRLKDTSGDAPKSRSWKSGFLKKGSAPITIVGASNGLALADHVGQRVSVTGTLVDREMRAQSLRRVSPSCK
jgi:type IV secretory pathway VirB10-like protein